MKFSNLFLSSDVARIIRDFYTPDNLYCTLSLAFDGLTISIGNSRSGKAINSKQQIVYSRDYQKGYS